MKATMTEDKIIKLFERFGFQIDTLKIAGEVKVYHNRYEPVETERTYVVIDENQHIEINEAWQLLETGYFNWLMKHKSIKKSFVKLLLNNQ